MGAFVGTGRARPALLLAVVAALLLAGVLAPRGTAAPAGERLDPAALPRGADPGVAMLVRDTIRDGALTVPATHRGRHDALWVVTGGYLLRDYNVGRRRLVRVVFVSETGKRRLVARSRQWVDVEVSPGGGRVAVRRSVVGRESAAS